MDVIRLLKAIKLQKDLDRIPEDIVRDVFMICGYSKVDLNTYCILNYIECDNGFYSITDKGRNVIDIKDKHKFLMNNGLFVESKNQNGKHRCTAFTNNNILDIPKGQSEFITDKIENTDHSTVFVSECPEECSIAGKKSKWVIQAPEM